MRVASDSLISFSRACKECFAPPELRLRRALRTKSASRGEGFAHRALCTKSVSHHGRFAPRALRTKSASRGEGLAPRVLRAKSVSHHGCFAPRVLRAASVSRHGCFAPRVRRAKSASLHDSQCAHEISETSRRALFGRGCLLGAAVLEPLVGEDLYARVFLTRGRHSPSVAQPLLRRLLQPCGRCPGPRLLFFAWASAAAPHGLSSPPALPLPSPSACVHSGEREATPLGRAKMILFSVPRKGHLAKGGTEKAHRPRNAQYPCLRKALASCQRRSRRQKSCQTRQVQKISSPLSRASASVSALVPSGPSSGASFAAARAELPPLELARKNRPKTTGYPSSSHSTSPAEATSLSRECERQVPSETDRKL